MLHLFLDCLPTTTALPIRLPRPPLAYLTWLTSFLAAMNWLPGTGDMSFRPFYLILAGSLESDSHANCRWYILIFIGFHASPLVQGFVHDGRVLLSQAGFPQSCCTLLAWRLGPPVVPFYPFLGEGSPRKQGNPYSNLSTGGPR